MRSNLRFSKHVEAGSALYSDALHSYEGLEGDYAHQVIDHAVAYVDGQVHTNGLENFWSLLKRSISGTYVERRAVSSVPLSWTSKPTATTTARTRIGEH